MSFQKCPACDGWGNRPGRTKQNKLVKCRACKGAGVLGFADVATAPIVPAESPVIPFYPHPYMPTPYTPPYVPPYIPPYNPFPMHPDLSPPLRIGDPPPYFDPWTPNIVKPIDGGTITVDFGKTLAGDSRTIFGGPTVQ